MSKQYISTLTALRGFAVFWSLFYYVDICTYNRDLGTIISRQSSGIISQGYLWVDFFFLLSGFFILHTHGDNFKDGIKAEKVRRFLWNRFSRIYPIHLLLLCVIMLSTDFFGSVFPWLIDDSWHTYFSYEALPSRIFMLGSVNTYNSLSWNLPAWIISAVWWTYVLSVFFLGFLGRQRLLSVVITSLLALAGLATLVHFHPHQNLDITWDFGFLRCLFEFILGANIYYLYKHKFGYQFLSKDFSFLLSIVMVALVFHFKIYDLFILPVFGLLILSGAYNDGKVKEIFEISIVRAIGQITFSISMVNSLSFFFFWFVFPHWKAFLHIEDFTPIEFFSLHSAYLVIVGLFAIPLSIHVEVRLKKWLRRATIKQEKMVETYENSGY
ncbi:acyltransferase [Flammeovirga sp. OC4]|uniref:acyltransferase family protein n=1 Tax=Flammeovirga sp. OC4 TaxID=1382345 RepID=UPI0005C6F7C8|nr:acyltransferase [Flammeovirga sp. OC4]